MQRLVWLFMGLCLGLTSAWADTTWVAQDTVSGVWTAEGSPYILLQSVRAYPALRIEPGVIVNADGPYLIAAADSFSVRGTADSLVTFTCDTAAHPGGWRGIWLEHGPDVYRFRYAVIENTRFETASEDTAGSGITAIYSEVELRHCLIQNNIGGTAGGILLQDSCRLWLDSCEVLGNGGSLEPAEAIHSYFGGGLVARSANRGIEIMLHATRFAHNVAINGGAIAIEAYPDLFTLEDCVFDSNQATFGGAIHNHGVGVTARHCIFRGNHANSGGAIDDASTYGTMVIECCLFVGNGYVATGSSCNAGAIYVRNTSSLIRQCTFMGNLGSAVIEVQNETALSSNILAFNTCWLPVDPIWVNGDLSHMTYCCVFGNTGVDSMGTGAGNISADPLLTAEYCVQVGSPCNDAGDPALPLEPDGSRADMGWCAYEHPQAVTPHAAALPEKIALLTAWPNPFNAQVSLTFDLLQAGPVMLKVYDLTGREIVTLTDAPYAAGRHMLSWNAEARASGYYFAVLQCGRARQIQKLLLLK